MKPTVLWFLAFIGAMTFVFAFKTKQPIGFIVYTVMYSACVATIVVALTT